MRNIQGQLQKKPLGQWSNAFSISPVTADSCPTNVNKMSTKKTNKQRLLPEIGPFEPTSWSVSRSAALLPLPVPQRHSPLGDRAYQDDCISWRTLFSLRLFRGCATLGPRLSTEIRGTCNELMRACSTENAQGRPQESRHWQESLHC